MPHTCVIRGCKNRAIPHNGKGVMVAFHRFPMKNNEKLACWENFVQQVNKLEEPWKATKYHRVCSDHFQLSDYIIPPSSDGTCRLKKYAIPSRSIQSNTNQFIAPQDELRTRFEHSNKRPFPPSDCDDLSTPQKVPKTAPAEETHDVSAKELRQKIRNLQQQLRRTKQRVDTTAEAIKVLQEKI